MLPTWVSQLARMARASRASGGGGAWHLAWKSRHFVRPSITIRVLHAVGIKLLILFANPMNLYFLSRDSPSEKEPMEAQLECVQDPMRFESCCLADPTYPSGRPHPS